MTPRLSLMLKWAYSVMHASQLHCPQPHGAHFRPGNLHGYCIDYTRKLRAPLVVDGVPANQLADGSVVVIPTAVAQYGLGAFEAYLTSGDERMRGIFRRCVGWLSDNQDHRGGWPLGSLLGGNAVSPYSCLTQAQGVSLLLRGFAAGDAPALLERATVAMELALTGVDSGGTARYMDNAVVFEEVPQQKLNPILNGWLFALLGLYEMTLFDQRPRYAKLLAQGVRTLESYLGHYDTGYWSRYDLCGRLASPFYHRLHVTLLAVCEEVWGSATIGRTRDRWTGYYRNGRLRCRAVVGKVIEKLRDPGDVIVMR